MSGELALAERHIHVRTRFVQGLGLAFKGQANCFGAWRYVRWKSAKRVMAAIRRGNVSCSLPEFGRAQVGLGEF